MANALFTLTKNILLGSGATRLDLDTDTIKLVFVDHADDTPVPATDDFLDDILGAARVATSTALDTPSISAGAIDFADEVVSTVTGDPFESIVVYKDSGVEATSPLIVFYDTATGLPFTPSGGNITITWNASGLFSI